MAAQDQVPKDPEVLTTLVDVLDISFDFLFTSPGGQGTDLQEIIGLYRACPRQRQRLILALIRAMAYELVNEKEDHGLIRAY